MFTIVCIIVGGLLIIILSCTLDSMVSWCLRRRGGRTQYSRLESSTNETLQTQRLAHEATEAGTWSRTTDAVPVTTPEELLAAGPAHPRLRSPVVDEDRGSNGGGSDNTPIEADEKMVVGWGLMREDIMGKEDV